MADSAAEPGRLHFPGNLLLPGYSEWNNKRQGWDWGGDAQRLSADWGGDGILTRTLSTGGGDALRPSAGLGEGMGRSLTGELTPPGLTDRFKK